MRTATSSLLVIAWIAGLVLGCEEPPADLKLKVHEISSDKITIEASTRPGLKIGYRKVEESRVEVGADGKALFPVRIPKQGELTQNLADGRVELVAVAEGLFGAQRVGQATLETGLDFRHVRAMPADAAGIWYVGREPRHKDPLAEFSSTSLASKPVEVGVGLVGPEGGDFIGPPGAKVSIGASQFTIGPNGLGRYKPTGVELLTSLPRAREISQAIPVTVEHSGKGTKQTAYLKLLAGGSKAICAHVSAQVEAKRPLAPTARPDSPQVLVCRANGELSTHRLTSKRLEPGLANARYALVESERSRSEGSKCTQVGGTVLLRYSSGRTEGRSTSTKIVPKLISTTVNLVDLTSYESLGTVDLDVEQRGCALEIYPPSTLVSNWLREQLKKSGRRR